MDNQGNVLNTSFTTNVEEISQNASVSTIISKQSSIISEGDLVAKEEKDGYDEESKNKYANQFIKFLRRPNSEPAPKTLSDLNDYMLKRTYQNGVGALIFCFNKTDKLSFDQARSIRLAKTVKWTKNEYGLESYYRVTYDNTGDKFFKFNDKYLNYTNVTDKEIQILFVFGNFDEKTSEFRSIFNDKIEYICLQNYLVKFATSFHKNACFPSQVIKISYKGATADTGLSQKDMDLFKQAVDDFKIQLMNSKGARNSGGMIIPSHPSLEIDIKPLTIPTNAEENINYHNLVHDEIFSLVDGGSYDAYSGQSEYSNNANAKLQEMYDGAIRSYKKSVLDKMNVFMENLLIAMRTPAKNIYLAVNTSKIKLYQKQMISQATMIAQNNGITLNEYRKIIKLCSDEYSFLIDNKNGDVFNGAIVKNETKPNPTTEKLK